MLDLCYTEDSAADTDMNIVMSGAGDFIEVQGTAEGAPFDRAVLDQLLDLGAAGCATLTELQQAALALMSRRASRTGGRLATNNAKKLAELRRIVAEAAPEIEILGLADVEPLSRAGRDRAHLRGQRAAQGPGLRRRRPGCRPWPTTPGWRSTCSNGMPGVRSARWAGPDATDESNNDLLLAPAVRRAGRAAAAQFVCAMALVLPDGTEHVRLGEMPGRPDHRRRWARMASATTRCSSPTATR